MQKVLPAHLIQIIKKEINVIQLGQEGIDEITGFRGIVVGISQWLTGCVTIGLQAKIDKDGKKLEVEWFDIERIVLFADYADREMKKESGKEGKGGPILDTPRRNIRGK